MTDPNGAVVPGATVEVVQAQTNYRYQTQTNDVGIFSLVELREGTYSLRARAQGFKMFAADDVQLASRQVRRLDIKLQLGAVESVVEVKAGAAEIETESARISSLKTADTMKALPLNTRAMYSFLQLTPGVLVMTGGNAYMRFAGSRGNQENEAVDGNHVQQHV